MTNSKTTKKALLSSSISILLCFAMLIGSTFAWFTDNVATTNNIITAGNLDVELYYKTTEMSDWGTVASTTNVFKENTLWEPGHTEAVQLRVVNAGTLALKYQLGVNVASEIGSKNVAGQDFKLSDYIKYVVIDGTQNYSSSKDAADAVDATANKLNVAYDSGVINLAAKNDANDDDEKIVTLVVYMPTSVGNEANYLKGKAVPTINLGINLAATQFTSEEDSFGSDYDEGAVGEGLSYDDETGTYIADSTAGLSTAANMASTDTTITSVKYINAAGEKVDVPVARKSADITAAINAGNDVVVMAKGEYTLPTLSDEDGLTIVGADGAVIGGDNSSTGFGSNFGKNTTIKNVTFSGTNNGVRYSYAKGGTTTFEDCTFAGDSTYGFHIDQSNGATFIFNNCTFSGFNAFAGDLAKVTFNKCTFMHNGNYGHTNIWSIGEFINCTWGAGTSVGPRGDSAHVTIDGVEITDVKNF